MIKKRATVAKHYPDTTNEHVIEYLVEVNYGIDRLTAA